MKRPFMVWIGFISICCSKVAKEGKSCPRLLVLQRVAQNAKSCSKVAEHNLFLPTVNPCDPLLPLVTPLTPCYPLLIPVTPVTPVIPVTPC